MSFGNLVTDRYETINYERMRNFRLKRAVDQMKKDGIGCLVSWEAWDIRYLTGVYVTHPTKWIESNLVVVMKDGNYYLDAGHLNVGRDEMMEKEVPWVKGKMLGRLGTGKTTFTKAGLEPFVKKVAELMAKHGVSKNEPVALCGCTSELLMAEAFKDVGIKVVDGKRTMFEARKIRNQDEIECQRIANSIADAAFADIKDAIRPGIRECDLVGIGIKRLYEEGCDETMEFVVASGPRTNPLHIDFTDRMIEPGDLIIIDINGASFQGYKTCYYRTFSCGKTTAEQKEIYEVCRKMCHDGMAQVKAGNTTWDIAKKWPDSPKFWGYDSWGDVRGAAIGHGVGIPLHEFPWISYPMSKAEPYPIEENMVFAVETWYGKRGGKDGTRLEEIVAVTKDGYDLLTLWPAQEITEAWI